MGLVQIVLVATFLACSEGVHAKSSRIYGGYKASRQQFPYQVSLQTNGVHVCGGTLIDAKWVLTSALCANSTDTFEAVLGLLYQKEAHADVQRITVAQIVVHDEYRGTHGSHDIALVELQTAAKLTAAVKIARLPKENECASAKRGLISGWGYLFSSIPQTPTQLRWARLPIISNDRCRENLNVVVGVSEPLDETMLCTVGNEGIVQSICDGDSGGPLVVYSWGKAVVIGVTSWTVQPCGIHALAPSVYTNVCLHLDFIKRNTGL